MSIDLSFISQVPYSKIIVLLNILLIKATSDCIFINLSPILTIFHILTKNDIVDMSHDIGCHGNQFDGKLYVTIVTKVGIILNWLPWAEYSVSTTV